MRRWPVPLGIGRRHGAGPKDKCEAALARQRLRLCSARERRAVGWHRGRPDKGKEDSSEKR